MQRSTDEEGNHADEDVGHRKRTANEDGIHADEGAGHRNRKQVDPSTCSQAYKKPHSFEWSYICWHYLSSQAVARQVLSAQMSLTSVFGMGTGGPSSQSIPTYLLLVTHTGFEPMLTA